MLRLNTVAQQEMLWNALIHKKAIAVTFDWDCVRYIHPTKGWRRVANRRLALPDREN
jgi:hypothetical protein